MIKLIHRYFRGRWERYYLKSHWHLVLDLSLTIVIIALAATAYALYFYRPNFPAIGVYNPPVIDLNNPPLILNFSLASNITSPTAAVPLDISYSNSGSAPINKIIFDLASTDDNFILTRVELASSTTAASVSSQELILNQIPTGQSGELQLLAYFIPKDVSLRTINWQIQSQYNFSGQLFKATKILPPLQIAAQLSAQDEVYYTSPQGDQLGIGPIPPIVGIPTIYWIFWELKSSNDFKNVVVNTRLPQGVELGSGRSLLAGDFTYSTSTRQLIWKIPELKGQSDSYRLGFEVQIIPKAAQVGQVITLLNSPQYYAVDALTNQSVSGLLNQLTTNLETDLFNAGQGKVVSQ